MGKDTTSTPARATPLMRQYWEAKKAHPDMNVGKRVDFSKGNECREEGGFFKREG